MTREELLQLTKRLVQGPVPTLQKKVYAYQGDIKLLLDVLPLTITIRTRVTDACDTHDLPTQAERLPGYLRERLTTHIRNLQQEYHSSVLVVEEATLLVRYQVPLSFLYDLTGDAHAIILHVDERFSPKEWTLPSYVHYNPETVSSVLEQMMGSQFVANDRG